jgi:hypothetical protein
MADRLPEALRYKAQGFWPLPCRPGTKKPPTTWKHLQARPLTGQEMHIAWPNKSDNNVALMCGPPAHVLILNVNVKNHADGQMLLHQRGLEIPRTPEVITASSTGRAYLFRVPDASTPFKLHKYPKGWKGIELRGVGAIQVMPPSRTPQGTYRFAEGWTLVRLMEDLGDMPPWLLDLWISLDRGAKIFGRDGPENIGNARKRPPAAGQPTDLSPSPPTEPNRSQSRPAPKATTTPTPLTTITTTLLPCDYTDFDGGEVETHDDACTAHVCGLVQLDVSSMQGNWPFRCVLPGHGPDNDPSATWFKTTSGHFIYHDWHGPDGEDFWPVPDVFAAIVTGKLKRLPKPSRKTWRLRLMIEAGLLDPYPVEMKPLPDDMPKLLRHFCERFRYLCAVKWTYQERAPTMFSDEFAAGWCGIREGSIWKLRRLAIAHGFMVASKDEKGHLVYLPGKDEADRTDP